jgi:hypothetical protein
MLLDGLKSRTGRKLLKRYCWRMFRDGHAWYWLWIRRDYGHVARHE